MKFLVEHEVKKGEGMIGIMKRAGLDSKDWKVVYQKSYNAHLKKAYGKVGHIRPGDKVMLPVMSRKEMDDLIVKIETMSKDLTSLIAADLATLSKLKSLRRVKRDKWKAYKKIRSDIQPKRESKKIAEEMTKHCIEVDTKSTTGLGQEVKAIVNCATLYGNSKAFVKNLKTLEAEYVVKKLDSAVADAAVDALETSVFARRKLASAAGKMMLKVENVFRKMRYDTYG
ncbi:hypothetical protein [uncultured Tateyamaria sp.]|uniref:hypothetical protein n=1 Tax=uncultured Tateyamaria sp. TaxID=455651 RepID=UPI0026029319|nr:hypothetical protein [uncultured Tateyamaria sp.]